MACIPATETVTVTDSGSSFTCEAYVTYGATKVVPGMPYDLQKGRFRLFTTETVATTSRINTEWLMSKYSTPQIGRVFCDCVRPVYRNPCEVDLIEQTRTAGPRSSVTPTTRHSAVEAGMVANEGEASVTDERKLPSGAVLFVLREHSSELVAERWQIDCGGKRYKVFRVIDRDRPDRPPVAVCVPDRAV